MVMLAIYLDSFLSLRFEVLIVIVFFGSKAEKLKFEFIFSPSNVVSAILKLYFTRNSSIAEVSNPGPCYKLTINQ
jgi:hypothetical protein